MADAQDVEHTKQLELPESQFDIIHELVLRGLAQTDPAEREYGEAYDAFTDGANYPFRIGDQPERVRDVWSEVIEGGPHDE